VWETYILVELWVSNNRLTSLPNSVGRLQNLLSIYASNNTLTSLPETVGEIKSLQIVDLRRNTLVKLPSSVSQWINIEYLYVAGNPLCETSSIPNNLKGAKQLCKEQCSVDCVDNMLGDNICNDNDLNYFLARYYRFQNAKPKANSGCNTAACGYDKGDCPR